MIWLAVLGVWFGGGYRIGFVKFGAGGVEIS